MTQYVWIGGTSSDAGVAGNWYSIDDAATSAAVPAAGDEVIFDYRGTRACNWNIASITDMIWNLNESERFTFAVDLQSDVSLSGILVLNGSLTQTSNRTITFTNTTAENSKIIHNGPRASPADAITYLFSTGSSQKVRFDTGPHPTVVFNGSTFVPQFTPRTTNIEADGSKRTSTTFFKLTLTSGVLAPDSVERRDRECEFLIRDTSASAFACSLTEVNFGQSTFGLPGGSAASPRALPVTGSSSYGTGGVFQISMYGFRAFYPDKSSIGSTVSSFLMGTGLKLTIQKLIIDEGCAIFGDASTSSYPEIECCNPPLVRGSLGNFVKISEGVYRASKSNVLYPNVLNYRFGGTGLTTLGTAGQVLKVNSGATGLEWGAGGGGTTDIDALASLGGTGLHQTQDHFMFSDNGTEKKITFSNLEDAIFANVSGDATIAAGGALTIANDAVDLGMIQDITDERILGRVDNSDASVAELTKAQVLTMLNVEDGADVTDATNVAAAGALMDSELTDLAGVKGVTISTLQPKPSEGAFANGDKTKLDGIAANATAYSDTNAQLASLGVALTTVTLSTTVSGFTSGAYTIAPLDNVVKDVTSSWDGSNNCFTAPADGIYEIHFSASIQGLTTLSHIAITRIYKDTGSGYNFIGSGTTARQSGAVSLGSHTISLATGNKIALFVYHDGGSSKNLLGDNIAPNYTMMSIRMVGV